MRTSIVMVTFHSEEVIRGSLGPLVEAAEARQIVVVDNSADYNSCRIASEFGAQVIRTEANLGFAKAVNIALREADGDFVLLVNPDVRVPDGLVRDLEAAMIETGSAVVAPVVMERKEDLVVPAGAFPSARAMFLHMSGLSRIVSPHLGHYLPVSRLPEYPTRVDWVTGACMLVRTDVMRELNGMNERWFMYAEDIDFCFRLASAGYETTIVPSVRVEHIGGGSSAGVDGRLGTEWLVNLFDFYVTAMSPSTLQAYAWKAVVTMGFLLRAAVRPRQGRRFLRYARVAASL